MRRRKLLGVVAGLVVVLAAEAFVLWPQPSRVTRESFDHIHMGMSRAEVEAVLGLPDDYRAGPVAYDNLTTMMEGSEYWRSGGFASSKWEGDTMEIDVSFLTHSDGQPGGVCMAYRGDAVESKLGWLDRFLWRANRQWRRWFP